MNTSSQEPGARSQEPGARSQEPGARSQEHLAICPSYQWFPWHYDVTAQQMSSVHLQLLGSPDLFMRGRWGHRSLLVRAGHTWAQRRGNCTSLYYIVLKCTVYRASSDVMSPPGCCKGDNSEQVLRSRVPGDFGLSVALFQQLSLPWRMLNMAPADPSRLLVQNIPGCLKRSSP